MSHQGHHQGPYTRPKGPKGKGKGKGERGKSGQKGEEAAERQNRGWSQQRRTANREENFAAEARTALAELEENRAELMYCRTEETEEAAKKRTNKQRLLTAGRLSSRLREELAAEEWQNEASSSLSSRLQEEVAAEEWQNEASSSLSSRLQEEVEAEELQKQVYMHEHAEAKESVLLLHALNERLLSSRLQEEVEAEELQKQVYMHEHAEAKESVLLLHALNERPLYSDAFRDYWKLEEKYSAGPAAAPKTHDLQPANGRCSSQELVTSFLYSATERDSILDKVSCKDIEVHALMQDLVEGAEPRVASGALQLDGELSVSATAAQRAAADPTLMRFLHEAWRLGSRPRQPEAFRTAVAEYDPSTGNKIYRNATWLSQPLVCCYCETPRLAERFIVYLLRFFGTGGDAPLIKSVPFLPERFVKQASAALSVQAAWRGYRERCSLSCNLRTSATLRRCALCIQRCWRWSLLKRRLELLQGAARAAKSVRGGCSLYIEERLLTALNLINSVNRYPPLLHESQFGFSANADDDLVLVVQPPKHLGLGALLRGPPFMTRILFSTTLISCYGKSGSKPSLVKRVQDDPKELKALRRASMSLPKWLLEVIGGLRVHSAEDPSLQAQSLGWRITFRLTSWPRSQCKCFAMDLPSMSVVCRPQDGRRDRRLHQPPPVLVRSRRNTRGGGRGGRQLQLSTLALTAKLHTSYKTPEELAAERALCAWMRTSLATSKMMFVFGILPIALDEHLKLTIAVSISIALTVAALSALLAGWHRHGQLLRRGIDIRPALGSVGLYVIIGCLCVLLKS
eukprot:s119_g1.t4